jgi:hypothetical protein
MHPGAGKECYRHVSEIIQEFWYPIPLPGSFTTEVSPFHPLFLHAQTRRCTLKLGATFTNCEVSECLCCDFSDADGIWVGVLRLNLPSSSTVDEPGSACSFFNYLLARFTIRRPRLLASASGIDLLIRHLLEFTNFIMCFGLRRVADLLLGKLLGG